MEAGIGALLAAGCEHRLSDFEPNGAIDLTAAQSLTFLWGERDTSDSSVLLDRQVNTLNLLLQAVQWCVITPGRNTFEQQQNLLVREESRSILQQAKDCSSSIIGIEDSASFISENTAGREEESEVSSTSSPRGTIGLANQTTLLRHVNSWETGPKRKTMAPISPDNSQGFSILGTSESGKTTLLKGLKLAMEGSWTQEEKLPFSTVIWSNIVMGARAVLEAMERMEISLDDQSNECHVVTIFTQPATA
ncbi:hypothetical protein F4823DRAFT_566985 [Ustulina deusta]|nr:hypothetical protein F4823DRAFT_566985 [Ustulina deusta]